MTQLLNTVMRLHDEGRYTHNDIALSNVMVEFHGHGDGNMANEIVSNVNVRLIDFGLARRNEEIRDKVSSEGRTTLRGVLGWE